MNNNNPAPRKRSLLNFRENTELGVLIPLILIMAVTQIFNKNFLSYANMSSMLKSIPFIALATLGSSLTLISGNVDISIGRVAGLAGMFFGYFYSVLHFSLLPSILIALAIGVLIGLINGFLVVQIGMSGFIGTMGTLYVCGGWRYLVNGGSVITLDDKIRAFANQTPLGISWAFWIVVAIFIIVGFIQRKTSYGRYLYAVGNNSEVAKLQGVNVKFIKISVYVLSGFFAAIAGILATMDINSSQPSTGTGWEFRAVAGSVIGGVSLTGGVGSSLGVAIGVFMVFVISNIINMISLSNYWSDVFTGAVLLGAVIIDVIRQNRKIKG